MKLYRIGKMYVGTQADAKAEADRQGLRTRGWKAEDHEIEVPTDKPGLLAFLNGHKIVPPKSEPEDEFSPPVAERQDPPVEQPTFSHARAAAGAKRLVEGMNDDQIVERILTAPSHALAKFAGGVAERYRKLSQSVPDAPFAPDPALDVGDLMS